MPLLNAQLFGSYESLNRVNLVSGLRFDVDLGKLIVRVNLSGWLLYFIDNQVVCAFTLKCNCFIQLRLLIHQMSD